MKQSEASTAYRYQVYLEICLELVEEAGRDLDNGDNELAHEKLISLIEAFKGKINKDGQENISSNIEMTLENVVNKH